MAADWLTIFHFSGRLAIYIALCSENMLDTTYTCAFKPGCLMSHKCFTPQTVSYKMK